MDQRLRDQFVRICGAEAVLHEPLQLLTYECDALAHLRETRRRWSCCPSSAPQVQAVVRACHREGVPFVPAATAPACRAARCRSPAAWSSRSARLNRVLDVDIPNRRVTVEPGVTNLEITKRSRRTATTTRPIPRVSRCARSAATSRRTRAARIA